MDKPKREAILDLSKYVNERIRVKFTGGREGTARLLCSFRWRLFVFRVASRRVVSGILKGYDQLLNLVLDEVEEQILGASLRLYASRKTPHGCHRTGTTLALLGLDGSPGANHHPPEPSRRLRGDCESFPWAGVVFHHDHIQNHLPHHLLCPLYTTGTTHRRTVIDVDHVSSLMSPQANKIRRNMLFVTIFRVFF
jgi:small nuclear ribonucleoprotein (snRNP)-like protein